jgi:cellobiose-specific phosphotransferase system component IIC
VIDFRRIYALVELYSFHFDKCVLGRESIWGCKAKVIIVLLTSLLIAESALACKSYGKSSKDKEIASKFCTAYRGTLNVMETLMWVKVSNSLANSVSRDRITGKQLMINLN